MQTLKPGGGLQSAFTVKDPKSDQIFEFDEKQYFLCQAWDGKATFSQITTTFQEQFQQHLDENDLEQFLGNLGELGLLETVENSVVLPFPAPIKKDQKDYYLWSLGSPDLLFRRWLTLSNQFQWLWISLAIGTIPGVPIAFLTLIRNWRAFQNDLENLLQDHLILILLSIHFVFIGVNLVARISQGIVLTSGGGNVQKLGITLAIGFLPHVSIEMDGIERLDRQKKLWVFGSSLLTRLILMVVGLMLWFSARVTDTSLPDLGLLLTLACLINVLLDGIPFWSSSGYAWMVTYFRLPHLLHKSRLLWTMLLQGRPLPPHITQWERLLLSAFGLVSLIVSGLMGIELMLLFSSNTAQLFMGILGNSANAITLSVIVVLFVRFLWKHWNY